MTDTDGPGQHGNGQEVHQLLCKHRFMRGAAEGALPGCVHCGLGYREYVHGTVRGALPRMDAWD